MSEILSLLKDYGRIIDELRAEREVTRSEVASLAAERDRLVSSMRTIEAVWDAMRKAVQISATDEIEEHLCTLRRALDRTPTPAPTPEETT